MSQTISQRLALARVTAAGCAVRVKARKDYASDNIFAVSARRAELKRIVQRVLATQEERRHAA